MQYLTVPLMNGLRGRLYGYVRFICCSIKMDRYCWFLFINQETRNTFYSFTLLDVHSTCFGEIWNGFLHILFLYDKRFTEVRL